MKGRGDNDDEFWFIAPEIYIIPCFHQVLKVIINALQKFNKFHNDHLRTYEEIRFPIFKIL